MEPAGSARPVVIVSDHTGLTAESLARSLMAHFGDTVTYLPRPFVTTLALAQDVAKALIAHGAVPRSWLGLGLRAVERARG